MNRVILYGNVGRDPDIRSTNTGDQVATLSLATSERWIDKATGDKKDATEWHTIVVWNQGIVKVIRDHVKKGSKLLLEGKLQTRKYQDKTGADRWATEVVIGRFDGSLTLGGQPQGIQRDEHGQNQRTLPPRDAGSSGLGNASPYDDIPF